MRDEIPFYRFKVSQKGYMELDTLLLARLDELGRSPYKLDKFLRNAKMLVINLLFEEQVKIPLHQRWYDKLKKRRPDNSYAWHTYKIFVRGVVEWFVEEGWITIEKGTKDGSASIITRTDRFLELFGRFHRPLFKLDPAEVPLLIMNQSYVYDGYIPDEISQIIAQEDIRRRLLIMKKHRDFTQDVEITYEVDNYSPHLDSLISSNVVLTCRYGDAGSLGRIWQKFCPSYQQLPAKERLKLKLDGEPVAELDWPGMFFNILYGWEGLDCPCSDDPYRPVYESLGGVELRKLVKFAGVILLNCKSFRSFVSAIACWNFDDKDKPAFRKNGEPTKDYQRFLARKDLMRRFGIAPKHIYRAFLESHKPISKYFTTELGGRLQLVESNIMAGIMDICTDNGIVILPEHDSLICPAKFKEEARLIAEEVYYREVGRRIRIQEK